MHYWLDDRDQIVFVSEAWDAFALANSGEQLTENRVLGRPLWEFITDRTTRLLYRDILAWVRGGHPVRFILRCDSPGCCRLLEMGVSAGLGGSVEFRIRTLSEEPRKPQPLLDTERPHSKELLRMCGWCKKVAVCGGWVEVEEAVSLLGLFERALLPDVTHGICEDCYARVQLQIASLRKSEQDAEPRAAVDDEGM